MHIILKIHLEARMANEQQIQIKRDVKSLFADNVIVEAEVKVDKKNVKDKEFHVRFLFIDTKTRQVVSEVVLSRLTTRDLQNALYEITKKLDEIIKTGKLPEQPIKATSDVPTYMG